MGTLKTTNIQTITGSGTLTLGTSGETLVLGSGVTSNLNYPAFEAYLGSDQSVSHNTVTKVQINTEVLDTDNCYDNTTNYRFTPTVAGKYMIYGSVRGSANTNLSNLEKVLTSIYKNGSSYNSSVFRIDYRNNNGTQASTPFSQVLEFNGSTDYVEIFAQINDTSGNPEIFAGAKSSLFGAYRIGT